MEEKTYIYIQMIYGKFKAHKIKKNKALKMLEGCLLYTSPSPRD